MEKATTDHNYRFTSNYSNAVVLHITLASLLSIYAYVVAFLLVSVLFSCKVLPWKTKISLLDESPI